MNANTKIGYSSNLEEVAAWIVAQTTGDVSECHNWLCDGSLEDRPTLKRLAELWVEEGQTYDAG